MVNGGPQWVYVVCSALVLEVPPVEVSISISKPYSGLPPKKIPRIYDALVAAQILQLLTRKTTPGRYEEAGAVQALQLCAMVAPGDAFRPS